VENKNQLYKGRDGKTRGARVAISHDGKIVHINRSINTLIPLDLTIKKITNFATHDEDVQIQYVPEEEILMIKDYNYNH